MTIFNAAHQLVQSAIKYLKLSERFVILLFILGCSSSAIASVYPFSARYSRDQEVPPVVVFNINPYDFGNGTIKGNYDDVTKVISYTIIINDNGINNISSTIAANFHAPGAFGVNGPVIIACTGFPLGVNTLTYSNSHTITAAQETQLFANLWYSNILTNGFPAGEIRAQIILGKAGENCNNNMPPTCSILPHNNAKVGEPITIQVTGSDSNAGQTLGLEVIDFPFGPSNVTGLNNNFVHSFTWTATGNMADQDTRATATFRVYDNCGEESFCIANVVVEPLTCLNPVIVEQNTTINFNTVVPTYTGDPDLQPYFTWDKSGPTPNTWKAIFNLGNTPLLIKKGATITSSLVNGSAPGIVIKSGCFEIEDSGHIVVSSLNRNAGDIMINASYTSIAGEIRNEVKGTQGIPGAIKITDKKNISVQKTGLVQILGVNAGNTISLITCNELNRKNDTPPLVSGKIGRSINEPISSGIFIYGLVKSYTQGYTGNQNMPNIKVAAFTGDIQINASTPEPLYDEFPLRGSKFDLWGGLLSWVSDNVPPGKIEIQSIGNVWVYGHGDDPTGTVRKSFGAIAAIGTASDAPGGIVNVNAQGSILGIDRAFDVSGRNRLKTNYAQILLKADSGINLNSSRTNNSFNPVVDASSQVAGDRGGTNDIRTCGKINIGTGVLVSARVPPGSGSAQGTNLFTSPNPIDNFGTVIPPYITGANCSSPPLFTNCNDVNQASKNQHVSEVPKKTKLLQAYPNPFKQTATIGYKLTTTTHVTLKIFNTIGKEIAVLANEEQAAGQHHIQWDATVRHAGIYFVSLMIDDNVETGRLILIK